MKLLYFIIIGSLIWFTACNKTEPVCPDSQVYDFKLTLKRVKDSTSTFLKFYNAKGSIVSEDTFPTLLSVPVDLNSDSTTFFIDFINDTLPTITDTIYFKHLNIIRLQHQECGFVMNFEIDSLACGTSKNRIDSISWKNYFINEENESNLEIYY